MVPLCPGLAKQLMLMLTHVEKECSESGRNSGDCCVSWTGDGQAFAIRNKAEFLTRLLPLFFGQSKFPSFTRKLYRWGFRQISQLPGFAKQPNDMIFGHEYFKRDNKKLLVNMRSITAAGTRRAFAAAKAAKQKQLFKTGDNVNGDEEHVLSSQSSQGHTLGGVTDAHPSPGVGQGTEPSIPAVRKEEGSSNGTIATFGNMFELPKQEHSIDAMSSLRWTTSPDLPPGAHDIMQQAFLAGQQLELKRLEMQAEAFLAPLRQATSLWSSAQLPYIRGLAQMEAAVQNPLLAHMSHHLAQQQNRDRAPNDAESAARNNGRSLSSNPHVLEAVDALLRFAT
jgi:hypothetical protein